MGAPLIPITFKEHFESYDWGKTPLGPRQKWRSALAWSVDLMLASRDPIFLVWGEARTVLFNEAFSDLLGPNYPEALGLPVDVIWSKIWPKVRPLVDNAFAGNAAIVERVPLLSWSSSFQEVRYFTFSYLPVTGRDGPVLGAICTTKDVSEAVLKDQQAQKDRAALAEMFERAPGFMAMVEGPLHVFTFANAAFRKLVDREEVLGEPVADALPEMVGQEFLRNLDEVFRTGVPFVGREVPVQVIGSNGRTERRFVDTLYQPLRDSEGKVTGIFAEGHDVTDHCEAREKLERAEAEIRKRAETFGRTLDQIPQMVWSTRPDGHHDYFSAAWYDFTGATEGETNGEDWKGMFHPEDQPLASKRWEHSLVTGEPYEIEYRLRHKSGEYRWVLGRAWAEKDENGAIVRWYGTCTEIHDRVVAQARVGELQSELVHFARINAMSTMAATLAHEVNQPLAAATNFITGIRRMIELGATTEEVLEPLSETERVVHRAGDIIRRLRSSTSNKQFEKQDCSPKALIDNARRLAEAALAELLPVELHLEDDCYVQADPVRIEQVLINLLKNAAEAMRAQEAKHLTISTRIVETEAVFCIADRGPGLPAHLIPNVFDAFCSTKEGGMGIGLSVSRTIIEDHGGRIWAENGSEGGARFCFTLPLANPDCRA